MTHEELATLIRSPEDAFVERKTTAHRTDVTETLCAFANTPHERHAVLFIGVNPDGTIVGVPNPDKTQQNVANWASQCFPAVRHQCLVLTDTPSDPVVAVLVPTSPERPHFTGHAFVRVGARNRKASGELFDELIASRNTKAGVILSRKNQQVTLLAPFAIAELPPGPHRPNGGYEWECRIDGCSAHSVQLHHIGSGTNVSFALDRIAITADPERHRPVRLILRL